MSAFTAAVAALSLLALLQVTPGSGPGDPRLQVVAYDADQVVRLEIATGYHLAVIFAPDERIESVAIGNAAAWQATASRRGDYLFVKALAASGGTNLTVITDTRVYSFELVPSASGSAPFAVRFTYPAAVHVQAVDAAGVVDPVHRYRLRGARKLRPDTIHDDGMQTYMTWPPGVSMPAVFAQDERGEEVLVDGSMIDGRYVLSRVYPRILFRSGRSRASAERRTR